MSGLRLGKTLLFRGDLFDTASLIGLAQSRANLRTIAFTGELNNELVSYCEVLNSWLRAKGFPPISIHPFLIPNDFENLLDRPHRDWGWSEKECEAAVRLAGLPLPPAPRG